MQEIFIIPLDSIATGLKGVAKSTDTSLVYGKDLEEHDQRMHALLTTLAENLKAPQNITKLRRFMVMAQQLSKFTTEPWEVSSLLKDLLCSKFTWISTPIYQTTFEKTKQVLTSKSVLAHFNINKKNSFKNRISDISAMNFLPVSWRSLAYASWFLSTIESNYHPIEIEILAVLWGFE